MSLRDLHATTAWVLTLSNGVAGIWTTGAHWIAALRVRVQWWLVAAAQAAVVVQVVLGVLLQAGDGPRAPGIHVFYGFVTLITVALLYAYRQQLRANLYLLYGLGCLFVMGLGIRGIVLA